MSAIQRLKPFTHYRRYRLQMAIRVLSFPEPPIRQGYAGQTRQVIVLGNLLAGVLFECFYVGIVEPTRWVLTGVKVADKAIGLQALDVLIDLSERHLFIRNTAPRGIPSIGDEDVDIAIDAEQLR
jgi:hypothetical protein